VPALSRRVDFRGMRSKKQTHRSLGQISSRDSECAGRRSDGGVAVGGVAFGVALASTLSPIVSQSAKGSKSLNLMKRWTIMVNRLKSTKTFPPSINEMIPISLSPSVRRTRSPTLKFAFMIGRLCYSEIPLSIRGLPWEISPTADFTRRPLD